MGPLDEIIDARLKPIVAEISARARQAVIDGVCQQKCGHGPYVKFCQEAEMVYREARRAILSLSASRN